MKAKHTILRLVIVLCNTIATTAVFGQTTYVWTNQTPLLLVSGDMNQPTNWTPNGIPRPDVTDGTTYGDEMQFDGRTTGALAVTQNGGIQVNGGGSVQPYGLRIHLTSNQTSSVTIQSSAAISAGMRVNYFAIDAGSGGMILGGHNGNAYNMIAGVLNGQILGFTNNSSAPSEITEGLRWTVGGAGPHPFVFTGTGDWIVNNHMRTFNGNPALIQKFGSGTMTWTGTNNANAAYVVPLGNPITIGGGTMIWKTPDLAGGSAGNPDIINNGTLLKYDASDAAPCFIAGTISGSGPLEVSNGILVLSGANTYTGGTLISGGTLQVGTNGPTGSLGSGSVTNNSVLVFSRSDDVNWSNVISGVGSFMKLGSGTLTLLATNSYQGTTTVSSGVLVVSGGNIGGDLNLEGGTIAAAPANTVATLNVGGNMNIDSGTVLATLNKTLSPSNTTYPVTGMINRTGGTLKLITTGVALAPGDKFFIFNQPVTGGAAMPIISPGATIQNNLAVDGSVAVQAAQPLPTISVAVTGGTQLNLSWPAAWTGGVHLQSQTNSVNIGLAQNWVDIAGTDTSNTYSATINKANGAAFYRLVVP